MVHLFDHTRIYKHYILEMHFQERQCPKIGRRSLDLHIEKNLYKIKFFIE